MRGPPALEDRDAHGVVDLVEEVSGTASVGEYARVTMAGLYDLINCIDVSYNEMVPSEGRIEWSVLPDQGDKLSEFAPVFEKLMRQNPLVRHFEDTGDTRAMMWSDFVSLDELEKTPLYQEMFRPLGVASQMAVTLPTPPGIIVGFAVNSDPRGFDDRDRAILNALRPHLAHAYRAIQLRDALAALKEGGWTGALADQDGIIESVTENASALEAEAGIELSTGEPLPDEFRHPFRSGIVAYDPNEPAILSRSTRLSDEAGGVAGWYFPGPIGPHVVLVQSQVDTAERRLVDAGLTPRQIEVAMQLSEGGTNAAIAARLGVAEGTLRKHLERIYRALDVTDRASAIARIRGW